MYVNIVPIDEQPLVCKLKRNLSTPQTIAIVPVRHLHTESPVFLLWMRVKRRSNRFYSFFRQIKLIVYCHNSSHNRDWMLIKWRWCETLMFLLHLFRHFLYSSVLYTFTRLEQVSGHNLHFSLLIFLIIIILVFFKIKVAWNQILWI